MDSKQPYKILIIEDNLDSAESLVILLQMAGYAVASANDGAQGLVEANSFRPDVVLCDITLDSGLDGYAVARALRENPQHKNAYLVAMSGFGDAVDQSRALEAGFHKHLTKPVDPDGLEKLLSEILQSK